MSKLREKSKKQNYFSEKKMSNCKNEVCKIIILKYIIYRLLYNNNIIIYIPKSWLDDFTFDWPLTNNNILLFNPETLTIYAFEKKNRMDCSL